jgi:hypothetical protein
MSLIQFQRDRRPHHGCCDIFINPEHVGAVCHTDSQDNPTEIVMRNGESYHVMGLPHEAAKKINDAARKEAQP